MKTLITLFFLFVGYSGYSQFVALFGIEYTNNNTLETFKTEFEYNYANSLVEEITNFNEAGVNLRVVYLDNNKYDSLIISGEDYNKVWVFNYNDSADSTTIIKEENDIQSVYSIKEEDNRIISVELNTIQQGNEVKVFEKKFSYDEMQRIDTVSLIEFENMDTTLSVYHYNSDDTYDYIDDLRLNDTLLSTRDTFIYDIEYYYDYEYKVVRKDFENNILLDIESFDPDFFQIYDLVPYDLYDFLNHVFEIKNEDILYEKNSQRAHKYSTLKSQSADVNIKWIYSFVFNTKEIPVQLVSVYPNPSDDFVNIDIEGIEKVEIYSIMGELVKTDLSREKMVDISYLEAGMYNLIIYSSSSKNYLSKIVKE